MQKKTALLVGGTGQIGLYLSKYLIKKKYKVFITSRKIKKKTIEKLDYLKIKRKVKLLTVKKFEIKKIKKILLFCRPNEIYYLAGQSSVAESFKKKKETFKSNVDGCHKFLESTRLFLKDAKFFNASSSEIFGNSKKKIRINTKKNPVSPYGKAKLNSFKITDQYRKKYKLKTYNGIIFNSESYLRSKKYLIPKICLAAINTKKDNSFITEFGNIDIYRDWGWSEEQVKFIWKHMQKKPGNFIIATGKSFKARNLIEYAFKTLKLNYKKNIKISKKYIRPKEINKIEVNVSKKNQSELKVNGIMIIRRLLRYYIKKGKTWN